MSNYGTAGLIIDNDIDIEVNTGYFDTDIVNDVGLFFWAGCKYPPEVPLDCLGLCNFFFQWTGHTFTNMHNKQCR